MRNLQTKVVEKIKRHISCLITPHPTPTAKNRAVCEIVWEDIIEPDRPQIVWEDIIEPDRPQIVWGDIIEPDRPQIVWEDIIEPDRPRIVWEDIIEPDRPQMKEWRMFIACWIPKATNPLLEYVVFIAFPQWLHQRASMLSSCLVINWGQ
jgi:hypothetical protein